MPDAQEWSRVLHELFCTEKLKIGLATPHSPLLLLPIHSVLFSVQLSEAVDAMPPRHSAPTASPADE